MTDEDWNDLAQRAATRDEFVRRAPYTFLLALSGTTDKQAPARTMRLPNAASLAAAMQAERRRVAQETGRMVFAIRKRQGTFAGMITVGRAPNNDIIILDGLVSKFHAWFRLSDGHVALGDAGSANGTMINDVALVPNADPKPLSVGDKVSFGLLAFRFVDAGGAWASLHK